ncbi:type VI secretion system ATPase TssH [Desulfovibrio sp. ZJ200]|uniref:type VI secretion system ATPase TssH n=1 Tax=Desulfovibrio sp. ZJ200 TaxID=2709792 RepID=UPI0013ECD8B5|nr:type VI secretion system ATPase TssH [Desulfovibrio sp. ZJ200]
MIGVDMKGLIDKCNGFCTQALHAAAGMTVSREHYEVTFEHFLLACLEEPASDASLLLAGAGADMAALKAEIKRALASFRAGNTGRPVFSPTLQDALEAGWLVSSVDLRRAQLCSGGVLLAFLRRPNFYAQGDYTRLLREVSADELLRSFARLTGASCETGAPADAAAAGREGADAQGQSGAESFIARFCEDITAKAQAGKLDPVFGRDREIRQMVDILARRRKNNPILVGEPGVGKTAVMEGLALRISQGDVPETLRGVTLLSLDMGLLEAGASVKGEFERRLKGVLDEIKAATASIILFIDEAHLLVGGGNGAGGSDAANLMKPALARGEIRTCAATTWKEYKKYFEKDAALARRFQIVKLDEPSATTTALILRGLKANYEKAHNVLVRDEALQAAADFADRYISGRFLPDKAVDLLDTACARVRVSLAAKPAALEDAQHRAQSAQRELTALERDAAEGVRTDPARLKALRAEIAAAAAEAAALESVWREELELARAVLDARDRLRAARDTPDRDAALAAVLDAREALAAHQGDAPLLAVEVTPDVVAQVVSDWTGIPVGKVAREQAAQIAGLPATLNARIRGQDAALAAVVEGIQAGKAGLRAPEQPLGVFLLAGPSGVGKTETGLALADALFGDETSVITVNMSEFQEKHSVSRLIGSPPGYVGYGEGGMLTEAVRRRPYAVVLLDEAEKAHPDVMQLFYQVFDKGVLTDGEGTEVSFRNTVILLTSNLGSEVIQAMCESGEAPAPEAFAAALRPLLSRHFQPALLARMRIVPYVSLGAEALRNIAALKLGALAARLRANNGMACRWTEAVPEYLALRCTETETGARNIDHVLAGSVLPRLARNILEHMAGGKQPRGVVLDVLDNELDMTFEAGPAPDAGGEDRA